MGKKNSASSFPQSHRPFVGLPAAAAPNMATKTPQTCDPPAAAGSRRSTRRPPPTPAAALSPPFSPAPLRSRLGNAAVAGAAASDVEKPCVRIPPLVPCVSHIPLFSLAGWCLDSIYCPDLWFSRAGHAVGVVADEGGRGRAETRSLRVH